MSRILKAYETQFRWLLQQARARRLDEGVQWLVAKAQNRSETKTFSLATALSRTYQELANKPFFSRARMPRAEAHFFCDAGLGGLARWLRAAGYESEWEPGIDDEVLLRRAKEIPATLLTTDSMLMERRLLRDRVIQSFWLPPALKIQEQLTLVFQEFGLNLREPRCMSCGGKLVRRDKEQLRDQIPPRTYRWLDDYFVCNRCGKLFWHGTHWRKIAHGLALLRKGDTE
jgi:uncharacterized protein with PIN domain